MFYISLRLLCYMLSGANNEFWYDCQKPSNHNTIMGTRLKIRHTDTNN